MDGATLIAKSFQHLHISHVFGIVGIPVTPLSKKLQEKGIQFVAMRNEQAARYAAGAAGFLSGKPAVCLTVAGPGMVHAIPGLLNANANGWPMVLLSAACESNEEGRGAFQESSQLEAALPYVKHAVRISHLSRFPSQLEQALRISTYGKPGPVYIEVPADLFKAIVDEKTVKFPGEVPNPPEILAHPRDILAAISLLKKAEKPLIIVGAGAAYARAEKEINDFLTTTKIPFLPSPMGKGLVPDDSELSVAAARTLALQETDVVFTISQPLNWMFAYGEFSEKVQFIQLESHIESLHHNQRAAVALTGDIKSVMHQLNEALHSEKIEISLENSWWKKLREKKEANTKIVQTKCQDNSVPLNYYRVFKEISDLLPKDTIIINEGANTLDIGRNLINNYFPRHRLDSGVLGTMGVGLGYAIAAAIIHPDKKVVTIQGDSAFGFSGMEVEVACRYQLPITFIVLNNNGIYSGISQLSTHSPTEVPTTAFVPDAHYEKIVEAFGGKGFYASKPEELNPVLSQAFQCVIPSLVTIAIDPSGPIPRNVQKQEK